MFSGEDTEILSSCSVHFQPALRPGDQTKDTTSLWKLAGEEDNLPYLIPLLKKYKDDVPEKHYIVSLLLSRSILRYYGMAPMLFCI